jgi:hypothetical protein
MLDFPLILLVPDGTCYRNYHSLEESSQRTS